MADLAIDPTDIRTSSTSGGAAGPLIGRKTLIVAGGVTLGVAALAATVATIVSNVTLPSSLSGLAFLPKPDAPRRSEIRIGRLPDMPEIRDGVPAVIGAKPVRVVEHGIAATPAVLGPKPVAATVVPAASLPSVPLPSTFTGVRAPPLVNTAAAPISPERFDRPAPPVAAPAAPVVASAAPVLPAALVRAPEAAPTLPAPPAKAEAGPVAEPASTASLSPAVPLPPPAPVRTAARVPEPKPERPAARPAQLASRQAVQPVTPSPAEAMSPPAPPPEDRVEILGVKLPNGSDLKNAVSSIGEALNLPKAF